MTIQTPSDLPGAASIPDEDAVFSVSDLWKVFGVSPAEFGALSPDDRDPGVLQDRGFVPAVQQASFEIFKGEVFVIMGLSGSGKSTLLRCLTRLIEPTSGSIYLNDQDLIAADDKALMQIRRKYIGMVFQNFALLPNRTVLDNITFPLEVQKVARDKASGRAEELISLVGLEGREGRYPSELSGGQQQRIGIARSLATDPEFWLLDEPFSALDPLIRSDLQDEVIRLQQTLNKTSIFVTHDLDEAIRIADRIAIMESGRIVQIGTAEELVTQPATNYVRRFVSKIRPAQVISARSLVTPTPTASAAAHTIQADAKLDSFAHLLAEEPTPIAVVDANNRVIGEINQRKAIRAVLNKQFQS